MIGRVGVAAVVVDVAVVDYAELPDDGLALLMLVVVAYASAAVLDTHGPLATAVALDEEVN